MKTILKWFFTPSKPQYLTKKDLLELFRKGLLK